MGKKKSKPVLWQKLAHHFGTDPGELPVIERMFDNYERPNLHQAVADLTAGDSCRVD